jgi:hypothetical protein
MSLNHIIKNSVSDNDALDVKFKNIVCNTITASGGIGGNYQRYIWEITNEPISIIKLATPDDYVGFLVNDSVIHVFITHAYSAGGSGTASIIKNGVVVPPKTIDFALEYTDMALTLPNDGDILKIMVSHNSDDKFTPYELTLQRTNLYMNAIINRINIEATPPFE